MKQKSTQKKQLFPKIALDKRNLYAMLAGFVVLTIGYILLAVGPWDNPISRSLAPMILLVGYLVFFPAAIFLGSTDSDSDISGRSTPPKDR